MSIKRIKIQYASNLMFMIIFIDSLQICANNNVHIPDTLPVGIKTLLTHTGFTKYAQKNVDFLQLYIQNLVVKDIAIEVPGFLIQLMDFGVTHLDLQKLNSIFMDGGGYAKIENINLQFKLNFKIQQIQYPYVYDSGEGVFVLQDFNLQAFLSPYVSQKCKYHYAMELTNISTSLQSVRIQLNGKMAFIYDAIMRVLTDKLVAMFNSNIGVELVKGIEEVANNGIFESNDVAKTELVMHGTDERVKYVNVDPDFIYCDTFGQQLFNYTNKTNPGLKEQYYDGDHNINIKPPKKYYTNAHIQYHININIFQSVFNNYVTSLEKKLFENQSTLVLNATPKIKKFVNMGAVLQIDFQNANVEYLVEFSTDILVGYAAYNYTRFLIKVSQSYQLKCDAQNQSLCLNDIPKFITTLNNYLHEAPLIYVNGNGIEYCETQVYQDDWLLASCYLDKKQQVNQ